MIHHNTKNIYHKTNGDMDAVTPATRPSGAHVGFTWARWANVGWWATQGGPIWAMCGPQWAWVTSGQTKWGHCGLFKGNPRWAHLGYVGGAKTLTFLLGRFKFLAPSIFI